MKIRFIALAVLMAGLALSSCTKPNDPKEGDSSSTELSSSSQSTDSLGSSSSALDHSSSSVALWPALSYSAADSVRLIDDFEDAADPALGMLSVHGGSWFTFTDNQGGASVLTPLYDSSIVAYNGSGYESNGVLAINYKLDKGTYQWAPYVAIGVSISGNLGSPVLFDASSYAGFEYWYRGPAHRMRVEVAGVVDWDFHFQQQGASKTAWKKVIIDFAELMQEGWGDTVQFTPDQLKFLTWELRGTTGDSGSFEMDQLRFLDTIIYPIENNMVLRDPLIPALDSVGDLSVTTAFNQRVIPYLTKGLNFTNWLEQSKFDGSTWTYDEQDVIRHASQGFQGLRLPIDLDLYVVQRDSVVAGTKAFTVDSLLWQVLDSFDLWTSRHGLSFTIDYHQYDGSFNGTTAVDEGYRSMAANVWKAVAGHYKNSTRDDLFFELTNEPDLLAGTNTISTAAWRALAQQMIDSIRTQSSTIPIIYGATNFYSLDNLEKEDVLNDSLVIYAFHFYDPFIFTHQGASWAEMGSTRNIPFPYSKEEWNTEFRYFGLQSSAPTWIKNEYRNYYMKGNRNYIMNRILKIKRWAHARQVPLICNEWGAYQRTAKIEHLNNYNRTMGEIFTELDIAWQVWFGVFDGQGNLLPGLDVSLGLVE